MLRRKSRPVTLARRTKPQDSGDGASECVSPTECANVGYADLASKASY